MSRLCEKDREIIAVWRELGAVPDDLSTRQAAVRILGKAMDDVDEMHDIVNQLLEHEPRLFVETTAAQRLSATERADG